jgi:hypothetical protein
VAFGGGKRLEAIGEICALPACGWGRDDDGPVHGRRGVQREVFASGAAAREAGAGAFASFEARHLSMGMSGDFEVAVEEGSTL